MQNGRITKNMRSVEVINCSMSRVQPLQIWDIKGSSKQLGNRCRRRRFAVKTCIKMSETRKEEQLESNGRKERQDPKRKKNRFPMQVLQDSLPFQE